MIKKTVITAPQLFNMLFISRSLVNLTYNPVIYISGENIFDYIISSLISFLLNFILILPVYFLYKLDKNSDIIEKFTFIFKKTGIIFAFIYIIYFLLVNCYSLSSFNIFMTNAMNPDISAWLVSISVVLAACYGANKGIEGLARTCGVVLVMIIISLVFLICALLPEVDEINYTNFFQDGFLQSSKGILMNISQNFCIPALGILLPMAKGNIKKNIFFWNFYIHVIWINVIFLLVGSLGDYLKTQIFPVYTAVSISKIGALKRLDAIYLGLWTMALFCKISLFLFLISQIFNKLFGEKAKKISLYSSACFIIIFSSIFFENNFLYNLNFLFIFNILTAFILPGILLLIFKNKNIKNFNKSGEILHES